ncbi:MAG: RNA polymerase sigma factor [Anaerolineae bacterium]|nr:RNA polymerase sigma factor [Anaerolineae bacterium]
MSDSLLLARVQEGDEYSFSLLFHRHYDRVYGLLYRLVGTRAEAEDLAQDVFLKLYRQRFAAGREHNVSAWLYRVATNAGYNALRSRQRRWRRDTALLPDATDAAMTPAEAAAQAETRAAVRAALAQLPRRDVEMLLLRQMGVSYEELASTCDVAPGSVGTMLRRAGEAFREAFREAYEREERGR